jgi:hypothetical protein
MGSIIEILKTEMNDLRSEGQAELEERIERLKIGDLHNGTRYPSPTKGHRVHTERSRSTTSSGRTLIPTCGWR